MDYQHFIDQTTESFKKNSIHSARLDSLLILEKITNKDKAYILAHPEQMLTDIQMSQLTILCQKRLSGQPVAYLLGNKEFYGRKFLVDERVLIPRPDSEMVIDQLKNILQNKTHVAEDGPPQHGNGNRQWNLLDVGTGSGCLAITAKLELPNIDVIASDISNDVIDLAKTNAKNLQADINFIQSDMFSNITGKFDIIIANLPYVPDGFDVSNDVKAEPAMALYSGIGGLDHIRRFMSEYREYANTHTVVLLESLAIQHQQITKLAQKNGLVWHKTVDLIQVFTAV